MVDEKDLVPASENENAKQKEEAVKSYTDYLDIVERGEVENVPAPQLAIDYYKMKPDAKLSDLIKKVRADEQHHSEINHRYADGDTSYKRKWT